ncbi:MAG: PKD domain-containing protein [Spirochaetales bacterium]|nr:PKD domain-containing protein [Spirochaetales bacterium]
MLVLSVLKIEILNLVAMRSPIISIFFISICFLLSEKIALSQENYASNISKIIAGEKLLIAFDLQGGGDSNSFRVILLLTHKGNQLQAPSVYGDVGPNIIPGNEKSMVWYYKNDFGGNIEEVSVTVFAYKENEPLASFEIDSITNNGYAPCQVFFVNNSLYANEYQWNFGNPASGADNLAFEKTPTHFYENGGIYSVALTARNTNLRLENTFYKSIGINAHEATVADFQIEGNYQFPPAKVEFKNLSVNADVFNWNFGDPLSKKKNESNNKDADHKYKRAGSYTVALIAKNSSNKLADTTSKDVLIGMIKQPEARFTYTKSSETAPSTVTFENTSLYATGYKWDFGDTSSGSKNSSDETNPTHVFTEPGNYKVELLATVKGEKKSGRHSEMLTIKELPKPPQAGFVIENNNVPGPATIVFTNNSKYATGYLWDFGDPGSESKNSSDKMNPTHTYTKPGKYKVVLTVSNNQFNEKSTIADYVIIH